MCLNCAPLFCVFLKSTGECTAREVLGPFSPGDVGDVSGDGYLHTSTYQYTSICCMWSWLEMQWLMHSSHNPLAA